MAEAAVAPAPALWLVDKPAGPTSHDVVAAARRGLGAQGQGGAFRHARPVRHRPAGADGRARDPPGAVPHRARQDLPRHRPDRRVSATLDPEGPDRGRRAAGRRRRGRGRAGRASWASSASACRRCRRCRSSGERLYRRARRGEEVELPEREIAIHSLRLVEDLGDGAGRRRGPLRRGHLRAPPGRRHRRAAGLRRLLRGPAPHARWATCRWRTPCRVEEVGPRGRARPRARPRPPAGAGAVRGRGRAACATAGRIAGAPPGRRGRRAAARGPAGGDRRARRAGGLRPSVVLEDPR